MARIEQTVQLQAHGAMLEGTLVVPHGARGVVLFAQGSGSGRHSPRNRFVAETLQRWGFATLLVDLLADAGDRAGRAVSDPRLDIVFLADRVVAATDWLRSDPRTGALPLGYVAASSGAAAALVAAVRRPYEVRAVVSRGGRPDLALPWLAHVSAPTLFIVGGKDRVVLQFNRRAMEALTVERELAVIPGAGHLFEEEGALERVADLTAGWLVAHLHSIALSPGRSLF